MISGVFMVPHPPLIIPEIGRGEEENIQDTVDAYHEVGRRIGDLKPETIVLISPHQIMYADYFHISPGDEGTGDFGQFRAPQVKIKVNYDTEFVENLCKLAEAGDLPAGTEGERDRRLDHGTMVPLYFVNQYWRDYKLVRIGLSGLSLVTHYELGRRIRETAEVLGRNIVVIASGDLSHRLTEKGPYGYREEGPKYDHRIMEVMGSGDFGRLLEFPEDFCEKAGECGHRSFTIMAGALDKTKVEAERLSYEGPFGVGYGICCYKVCGEDRERDFKARYEQAERSKIAGGLELEDAYVRLARKTIEDYILTGRKRRITEKFPEEKLPACRKSCRKKCTSKKPASLSPSKRREAYGAASEPFPPPAPPLPRKLFTTPSALPRTTRDLPPWSPRSSTCFPSVWTCWVIWKKLIPRLCWT